VQIQAISYPKYPLYYRIQHYEMKNATIYPSYPPNKDKSSEILYGVEKAVGRGVYFMNNVNERMDIFFDKAAPSIVVDIEEYREGYINIRKRGGKIRAFTEITKENVAHCKELVKLVDELRHLDDVRGGIAVSETEYMATTVLQENTPLTQVIYSNVKEVVEQGKYIYETLWKTGIPADQKIKEIEEGIEPIKTEVLENEEEISKRITELAKESHHLCACSTTGGMQLIYNNFFDVYKGAVQRHREGRHKGVKWITAINSNKEIALVKSFLNEGINVRHVKSVPLPSFALSDKMLNSTIEKMEGGRMVTNLLSSNDVLYLNHYDTIFKELWKTGIDAKSRIKDIEEGHYINVEVIPNPRESTRFVAELSKSAKEEILILLSSAMGFIRLERAGGYKGWNDLGQKGTRVKILIPLDKKHIDSINKIKSKYPHIEFKNLQFSLTTKIGMIIFDRNKTLIIEIKNDTTVNLFDAAGLAIYIEGVSTSISYASIFESLWKQTELYEQLQIQDKLQKEFINTAAHELRTPIQPIIGFANILKGSVKDDKNRELLDIIGRNAQRLKKLAEDILEVSKIESNSMGLDKEYFSIAETILDNVNNYKNNTDGKTIKFEHRLEEVNEDLTVYGDKNGISQVISNLISNSIKFIPQEGIISIKAEKKVINSDNEGVKEIVVVSVKDTGIGIDKELFPRLFTKFMTKSFQGIGLGLFISKSIVEAHGGSMWAENNMDDKGATVSFTLPI
jgi:two-component system, OmpR family, sensor histidine kinase VicK